MVTGVGNASAIKTRTELTAVSDFASVRTEQSLALSCYEWRRAIHALPSFAALNHYASRAGLLLRFNVSRKGARAKPLYAASQ